MNTSAILKYLSDTSNYMIENENMETGQRAKKRRLDHLTWEEKLQRKKLKNRVAAQTSRDRKKARLEQMESALQELFARNEALEVECSNLRNTNERLMAENADLQSRLSTPCVNCIQSRTVECETAGGSAESLLRPQGAATHSAAALDKTAALMKILLACLLYQTSSTNSIRMSISTPWNSSRKVSCKISPEIWKRLLRRQIIKNQTLMDKSVLMKWWGRHQNSWNPIDLMVKC